MDDNPYVRPELNRTSSFGSVNTSSPRKSAMKSPRNSSNRNLTNLINSPPIDLSPLSISSKSGTSPKGHQPVEEVIPDAISDTFDNDINEVDDTLLPADLNTLLEKESDPITDKAVVYVNTPTISFAAKSGEYSYVRSRYKEQIHDRSSSIYKHSSPRSTVPEVVFKFYNPYNTADGSPRNALNVQTNQLLEKSSIHQSILGKSPVNKNRYQNQSGSNTPRASNK